MYTGYMLGSDRPEIRIPSQRRMAGHAIGILLLDVVCPMLPGDVANASTYEYPVLYKVLRGVGVERLFRADPSILDDVVKGGKELEEQGVRAITTDCGYFGRFQKEVAAALDVPVFLSSLLQVPLISRGLKPSQKVGVICIDTTSLSTELLSACGIDDPATIVAVGAQESPAWRDVLLCNGHYDSVNIERELVDLAKKLVSDHPEVGALLLECSDMPPFALSIQNEVHLPVFDFVTMLNWVYSAVVRRPFGGFM